MAEVDIHMTTIDDQANIVEVTVGGLSIVLNGECHFCEQWPVTAIQVDPITRVCLECLKDPTTMDEEEQ